MSLKHVMKSVVPLLEKGASLEFTDSGTRLVMTLM